MVRLLTLICLVPTLLSTQATSDTTTRPITLNEAVRLAQRNSPLRSRHSAADATDVLQEFKVVLDVKRQYFDVLAAREAEEAARAEQELTQSLGLLRNAGQRVDVQLVSVAATEEDLHFQSRNGPRVSRTGTEQTLFSLQASN